MVKGIIRTTRFSIYHLPFTIFFFAACLSATPQPGPAPFNGSRAFEDLRQIVAIGPRPAGSPGAARLREYVSRQIKAAGLTIEEQPFEAKTPLGVTAMVNLRVTIPGADASRGRLIIGGHYDTKLFKDITFVGANDGGSSTAFLIELARVLKSRANAMPIELLFLDGEEAVIDWNMGNDHTYGSRYYVEAARREGTLDRIRAFILVDMIGDRDLRILREPQSTKWLTDAIWSTARQLKRREFSDEPFVVEDDHIEFLQAGVPAVDIIDLDYPAWHTANDTLDKCSAASLQAVADVLLAALPEIEKRLLARP
jgi:glutaminyl-peptide cyclotransferase